MHLNTLENLVVKYTQVLLHRWYISQNESKIHNYFLYILASLSASENMMCKLIEINDDKQYGTKHHKKNVPLNSLYIQKKKHKFLTQI